MNRKTFADKIIAFNRSLDFKGRLPNGIEVMNPFKERPEILSLSSAFYRKYYQDTHKRYLILGINPGRFGAGLTGIPFTDPKRLEQNCSIKYPGTLAHEPSSAFVYDMIKVYGGETAFFEKFYINSICPLGFTRAKENGKVVNFNYYDSKPLTASVYDFIIQNIRIQLSFGVHRNLCFCLGMGKNEKFLQKLNKKHHFFDRIISLEHPRYIMQNKSGQKHAYIKKYISAFKLEYE